MRNANLRLLLSARDARGELRTCAATLFDGAAYFHQPLGSAVKGGPSWVFPGPFFYELSVQAGAAPLGAAPPAGLNIGPPVVAQSVPPAWTPGSFP